jgi:hypothetical protein
MAQTAWSNGGPSLYDPDVLPSKRWAVFSSFPTTHKLTGSLNISFGHAIGTQDLCTFLNDKHKISVYTLEKVNTTALGSYLSSLPVFQHASAVKLMHNWVPTYGYLCCQGRSDTPICPRCLSTVKTPDHVLICVFPEAVTRRLEFLSSYLSSLLILGTTIYLLASLELKLSITLGLYHKQSYFVSEPIHSHLLMKFFYRPFGIKTLLDGLTSFEVTRPFIGSNCMIILIYLHENPDMIPGQLN